MALHVGVATPGDKNSYQSIDFLTALRKLISMIGVKKEQRPILLSMRKIASRTLSLI